MVNINLIYLTIQTKLGLSVYFCFIVKLCLRVFTLCPHWVYMCSQGKVLHNLTNAADFTGAKLALKSLQNIANSMH